MRIRLTALIAIAMFASGCSTTLGRTMPECDAGSATMVLAVQSVPEAHYVSCVVGLKAGWDYEDLEAQSGQSYYTLDSDRLGDGFVRVDNVESCDVGDATLTATDERGIELWKDVVSEIDIEVVVIPEGSTMATSTRAVEVILQLRDQEINGRPVVVTPSASDEPTEERIEDAVASGAHVVVISIRDTEEGTLTVLIRGTENEVEAESLEDALDMIEDVESDPYYLGSWFQVFEGGCVVYSFDAEGPGVDTIEEDIGFGLSLFDAEAFRQIARDAGYRLP